MVWFLAKRRQRNNHYRRVSSDLCSEKHSVHTLCAAPHRTLPAPPPSRISNSPISQAALARYRRKKERRNLVKLLRKQDPLLQEQNEARKRPRRGGKFTKERPDFVSICEVQKAAKSRSSSGEPPFRESTPPPSASARSGGGGRSAAGDKSRAAAGTRASAHGGAAK